MKGQSQVSVQKARRGRPLPSPPLFSKSQDSRASGNRAEAVLLCSDTLSSLSLAVQVGIPCLFYRQEPQLPLRWALSVSAWARATETQGRKEWWVVKGPGVRAGLHGQVCLGCQEPGLRQSCSGPWREHELTWQVRSPASAIKERKKSRETLNTNLLDQGVRRLLLNGGLTLAWEGKVFSI